MYRMDQSMHIELPSYVDRKNNDSVKQVQIQDLFNYTTTTTIYSYNAQHCLLFFFFVIFYFLFFILSECQCTHVLIHTFLDALICIECIYFVVEYL